MSQPVLSQDEIDAKVEELVASPVGCAFLVILEASGVSAAEAVRPEVALQAADLAANEINIWAPDFREIMKYVIREGPKLRELAQAILEQAGVDWWFAPIERGAQVWASREYGRTPPVWFEQPEAPLTYWEQRTNKSGAGMYTCTRFDDETSLFTALDVGLSEVTIGFQFPVACWILRVSESARVYEINGPLDWHRMCANYPARSARDASDPEVSDSEGWGLYPLKRLSCGDAEMNNWLTPDWPAVAKDWDGVHLTLGGLLTSDSVRVISTAEWSMHRFWDMEQTMWLRWSFDEIKRLPDRHEASLATDLSFPYSDYWEFQEAQGKDYGQAIATYRRPTG